MPLDAAIRRLFLALKVCYSPVGCGMGMIHFPMRLTFMAPPPSHISPQKYREALDRKRVSCDIDPAELEWCVRSVASSCMCIQSSTHRFAPCLPFRPKQQ